MHKKVSEMTAAGKVEFPEQTKMAMVRGQGEDHG